MAILEVNNIEKHFGSTSVLKDVSFSLEEGSALAIIGSSGSGKRHSSDALISWRLRMEERLKSKERRFLTHRLSRNARRANSEPKDCISEWYSSHLIFSRNTRHLKM